MKTDKEKIKEHLEVIDYFIDDIENVIASNSRDYEGTKSDIKRVNQLKELKLTIESLTSEPEQGRGQVSSDSFEVQYWAGVFYDYSDNYKIAENIVDALKSDQPTTEESKQGMSAEEFEKWLDKHYPIHNFSVKGNLNYSKLRCGAREAFQFLSEQYAKSKKR